MAKKQARKTKCKKPLDIEALKVLDMKALQACDVYLDRLLHAQKMLQIALDSVNAELERITQ